MEDVVDAEEPREAAAPTMRARGGAVAGVAAGCLAGREVVAGGADAAILVWPWVVVTMEAAGSAQAAGGIAAAMAAAAAGASTLPNDWAMLTLENGIAGGLKVLGKGKGKGVLRTMSTNLGWWRGARVVKTYPSKVVWQETM